MTNQSEYTPPRIWTWSQENGGAWASINRPISGATHEKDLPVGRHPLQLYSLGTPNGVKVTVMLRNFWPSAIRAPSTTLGSSRSATAISSAAVSCR